MPSDSYAVAEELPDSSPVRPGRFRSLAAYTSGWMLILAAWTCAGCSSGSTNPGPPDPVITITNQWTDENDGEHTFSLVSGDDSLAAGSFTGQETVPPDFTVFDLSGSWAKGTVQFTVQRPVPVTYTARFTENNQTRLVFSSTAGPLVISRGSGKVSAGSR